MCPPFSPADRDELRRMMRDVAREVANERTKPLEQKLAGVREELSPAVAKKFSESQHDAEDARMGFERMMRGVVGRLEEKVDTVVKSIPPAAMAASGAEAAAVVGAKNSIAASSAAIDSKTSALAAKVATHRAIIVQLLTAAALAAWQIYEHIVK